MTEKDKLISNIKTWIKTIDTLDLNKLNFSNLKLLSDRLDQSERRAIRLDKENKDLRRRYVNDDIEIDVRGPNRD